MTHYLEEALYPWLLLLGNIALGSIPHDVYITEQVDDLKVEDSREVIVYILWMGRFASMAINPETTREMISLFEYLRSRCAL